jgi:hypothetical protein
VTVGAMKRMKAQTLIRFDLQQINYLWILQFKFRLPVCVIHILRFVLLFPVLGWWSVVLCIWTGHYRCSILDCYRAARSQERASWSNSTSLLCCDICLYPFTVWRVKQMELSQTDYLISGLLGCYIADQNSCSQHVAFDFFSGDLWIEFRD